MDIEKPIVKKQSKLQNASCDIMFSILSKLPLRSLIRFSCVSKYWLDMIRDPYFASLHFEQTAADPMLLMLSQRTMKDKILSLNFMDIQDPLLHVRENATCHIVSSQSWNIVGTCNGLLCFTSENPQGLVMVCNPITREHAILPKPVSARPPESYGRPPESYGPMFGFGFDPSTKKYKVVRVFCRELVVNHFIDFQVTVEVYNLGDTGSWRAVQDSHYPPHGKPVYANGAVHWTINPRCTTVNTNATAHGRQVLQDRIVSFDSGREEFVLTPHPHFGRDLSVAELGGCLSVVDLSSPILAEVWVQRDHILNRWEREYMIQLQKPRGLDRNFHRLICIHEHNGVLLTWLQDSLVSYNPRMIRRRDLKIAGLLTWLNWEVCSGYRPSLVTLSGYPNGTDDGGDGVFFVSDMELYDRFTRGVVVCEQAGKCDNIIGCFRENGMLVP